MLSVLRRRMVGICNRFVKKMTLSTSAAVGTSRSGSSSVSLFEEVFIKTNGDNKGNNQSKEDRLLVFYDGGCPICSREIAFYDRLNRSHTSQIAFVNLENIKPLSSITDSKTMINNNENNNPSTLEELTMTYKINIPLAYRRLHALREDGSVHVSANAFCEIWQRLPYWGFMNNLVKTIPGAITVADMIYGYLAEKRIKWRQSLLPGKACSLGK